VDKSGDDGFAEVASSLGGTLRVRKSPKSLPLPRNTEEFRSRFATLTVLLGVAALKHSTRLWLRTTTPELWRSYVEHVLGEQVAAYKTASGGVEYSPSWEIVLSYEHQLRKLACKKVLFEDKDIATALNESLQDLQVKERYFITPLAVSAASSSSSSGGPSRAKAGDWRSEPYDSGKGAKNRKGDGKGGKSKSKAEQRKEDFKKSANDRRKQGRAMKTPDGRLICMGFQSKSCKYKDQCRYVHVCSKCFDSGHGADNCTK